MKPALEIVASEWMQEADALAQFTLERLVNRIDIWTSYIPPRRRRINPATNKPGIIVTAPFGRARGKSFLTRAMLARHYAGVDIGHLVGLHAASPENTSRWVAIDIDLHDNVETVHNDQPRDNNSKPSEGLEQINFAAAKAWWEKLRARGLDPLLFDSNGRGGYHIVIIFEQPAPTPLVHAYATALIEDFANYGLLAAPETYPRSPRTDEGHRGSALRLPGRHHTHDHFTRVWSGDEELDEVWLEGRAAIQRILEVRLTPLSVLASAEERAIAVAVAAPPKTDTPKRGRGKPPPRPSKKPVVCVDLDGVLATYDGWRGIDFIGDPISGAQVFTKHLQTFAQVVVYTSRVTVGEHRDEVKTESSLPWETNPGAAQAMLVPLLEHKVRYWLEKHGFAFDSVFAGQGKPKASAYIDDRAVVCVPQRDALAFNAALTNARKLCARRPEGLTREETADEHDAARTSDGLDAVVRAWDGLRAEQRERILAIAEDDTG